MKKNIILIIYFAITTFVFSFNFSVAPTRFNIDLNKIYTNEIILVNNTLEPLRLESFLETPPGYSDYNLNNDIKIYPRLVSIKPGGKQTVRFRVKPKSNLSNGEYKSYIVFREIPSKVKNNSTSDGMSVKISMLAEIGISIYGTYGEVNDSFSLKNLELDYKNPNLFISVDSKTLGNSSTSLTQNIQVLSDNNEILETLVSSFNRTPRVGENNLKNYVSIEDLKGKKVKVSILDKNNKIIISKTSNIF